MSVIDDEHARRRAWRQRETSASQIGSYESCPRSWFFANILGQRVKRPSAVRGTIIDDLYVQPYLLGRGARFDGDYADVLRLDDGSKLAKEVASIKADAEQLSKLRKSFEELPPPGEVLRSLLPLLPQPGPRDDLVVQLRVELPTYDGGPKLIGYADWMEEQEKGRVHVGDLKTTSDFKYAKSAVELVDDTQMISYAEFAYSVLEAAPVSVGHVVGRVAKKRKARAAATPRPHAYDRDRECKCVKCKEWLAAANAGQLGGVWQVHLTREHVGEAWRRRLPLVREMTEAAASCRDPQDMRPDTSACELYGGCPYKEPCGAGGGNFGGLFGIRRREEGHVPDEKKLTLKERLAIARGEKPEAAPPQATEKPVAELPACVVCKKPSTRQVQDAKGIHLLCATCSPPGTPATGVLPDDAPSRESTPEEIKALADSKAKKPKAEKKVTLKCPGCKEKVVADDFAAHYEQCQKAQAEQAAATEAPTPPPPAAPAPQVTTPAPQVESSAPAAEKARPTKQAPERKAPAQRPTIFVDCVPSKWPRGVEAPVPLSDWLAPIAKAVADHHDLEDLRLGPFAVNGSLAAAIRESIESCPETLLVDSREHGALIALEVIGPHAAVVVRGVR